MEVGIGRVQFVNYVAGQTIKSAYLKPDVKLQHEMWLGVAHNVLT